MLAAIEVVPDSVKESVELAAIEVVPDSAKESEELAAIPPTRTVVHGE